MAVDHGLRKGEAKKRAMEVVREIGVNTTYAQFRQVMQAKYGMVLSKTTFSVARMAVQEEQQQVKEHAALEHAVAPAEYPGLITVDPEGLFPAEGSTEGHGTNGQVVPELITVVPGVHGRLGETPNNRMLMVVREVKNLLALVGDKQVLKDLIDLL